MATESLAEVVRSLTPQELDNPVLAWSSSRDRLRPFLPCRSAQGSHTVSVGQLTPHDDDPFGLGGAAHFRVERRQRQSAPQREFQVRRIVQSKVMALR